jgi:hypothetical protein
MIKTRRKQKMPITLLAGVFLMFGLVFGLTKVNTAQAALADHLVINELAIDSVSGTGGTDDDWIELYNPTATAIDLSNWSIQKTSSSGATSSAVKITLDGISIPAKGYYLIARDDASTSPALLDLADLKSTSLSLAANNIIYLVNDDNKIWDSSDPNIVDFVGYGTAVFYEGSAAAPNATETKSISRVPDGEDTNQNSVDFILEATPTPKNSRESGADNNVNGTVVLTISPDVVPVENITPNSANIVFQVNTNASAKIFYGLSSAYSSTTPVQAATENATTSVNLSGLVCNTIYHYAIYAENAGATETETTADATFKTLPCGGIKVNSLTMTRTAAKANDKYADGWEWEFNVSLWNQAETSLKMKFDKWTGATTINTGGNMQYSVNNRTTWLDILQNNAYDPVGADISSIDNGPEAGRQVQIFVRMKVPVGTKAGAYNSNYGILTE